MAVLMCVACGGGARTDEAVTPALSAPSESAEVQTDSSELESRCVPASQAQIDRVRVGVKGVQESNDITSVYAVRSNDYERVWFVAAEITGPGIQPKDAVGLWAISGELDEPGLTLSVDGFAKEFSDWGDGTKTDAELSMFDDGAQDALDCAKSN